MLFTFLGQQSLYLAGPYLLATLVAATEVGYRIGRRFHRSTDEVSLEKQARGTAIVASAMLGLVSFVMAISISMAADRLGNRRQLALNEANAIQSAVLRAQGIGGADGDRIEHLLAEYSQLRLEFFRAANDPERLRAVYAQSASLQKELWSEASAFASETPTTVAAGLLNALTGVFDTATAQHWALDVRVPFQVLHFLHFASMLALGVVGYYFSLGRHRHILLTALLVFAFTAAVLLILDLDMPRGGYIRVERSPLSWAPKTTP